MIPRLFSPLGMWRPLGTLRVIAGIITLTVTSLLTASGGSVEQIFFGEYSTPGRVTKVNPDGTGIVSIVNDVPPVNSVAADPIDRKLYFSTIDGAVRTANFDGTGKDVLSTGTPVVGLQIDPVGRKLYTLTLNSISRSNLDGSERLQIAGGFEGGVSLEVDYRNGFIYYCANGQNGPGIYRVGIDGGNPQAVVTGPYPAGVAINPAANVMYYAAQFPNPGGVYRIPLNSATLPVIHSPQTAMVSLQPVRSTSFDSGTGQLYVGHESILYRMNADGSDLVALALNRQNISGIAVVPRKNRIVASVGQAAPGIDETTFRSFGNSVVNGKGEVAFDTVLASATGAVSKENDRALWSNIAGPLTLIARENGPTGIAGVNFRSWSSLHMSNDLLVFRARLTGSGVTAANDDAICVWNGAALRFIAREGTETDGFKWGTFTYPTINDRGQVLFGANYSITGARGYGLFITEPNAGAAVTLLTRGGSLELDGVEQAVRSFTKRIANAAEGLVGSTGYSSLTVKLSDGRTVLAVIAQ